MGASFDADPFAPLRGQIPTGAPLPPVDAPPVRRAVLADPRGAVFAVNTYTITASAGANIARALGIAIPVAEAQAELEEEEAAADA